MNTSLYALMIAAVVGLSACDRTETPQPPAPTPRVPAEVLKPPGPDVEASIKVFVNDNPLVVAFELVDVDLMANTRKIVWLYSDDVVLARVYEEFERSKIGTTPWMAGDQEQITRQQSVINGNYNCIAIDKTRLALSFPTILDHAKHVCVVGVPPEFGKFSGYAATWLIREPTEDELSRLVERMRSISAQLGAAQ